MKIVRHHLKTVSSTITWGKDNKHLLDPSQITLVTADMQMSGRGRGNRVWISPPSGNVYASLCFFLPEKNLASSYSLTQIAALTMAELITDLGLQVDLKWPNDLLIHGKKVGGILMELAPDNFVILSIGMNVNMGAKDLSLIDKPATSLSLEAKHPFDLEEIYALLESKFVRNYALFLEKGFEPFLSAYLEKVHGLIGKEIVYQQGNEQNHGVVESLTKEGYLYLRQADGSHKILNSGELI